MREVHRRAHVGPNGGGGQSVSSLENMSRLTGRPFIKAGERHVEDIGVRRIKRQVSHSAIGDRVANVNINPRASAVGGEAELSICGPEGIGEAGRIRRGKRQGGDTAAHLGTVG